MRRFAVLGASVLIFLMFGTIFLGCNSGAGGSAAVSVNLSPSTVSLNRGAAAQITAAALTVNNINVNPPALSYSSSNPGVITVSPSGLICAGQWDANFVNCRTVDSSGHPLPLAGAPGVPPVSITATFTINGQTRTSSAVIVTDHERIDSVKIVADPNNPAGCISQNAPSPSNTAQFTAQAFSNDPAVCGGAAPCQIPPEEIGAVNWAVTPAQVASIPTNGAVRAAIDPLMVTAASPGQGAIVGSIGPSGSAVSGAAPYSTCGIASIHVQKSPTDNSTSFSAPVGSTVTLAAIVSDTKGFALSSTVSLSWFTSQPAIANVSLGSVGTSAPGTTQITAACLPPSCNVGFIPPQPVFSDNVVTGTVTGTVDGTVLVATKTGPACTAGIACSNSDVIVPIDTNTNNPGTAFTLPAAVQVNSMVLTPVANPVFLGTSCSGGNTVTGPNGAACSGLLRFDPTVAAVASPNPNFTGTVLATDGTRVVLADPTNNQTLIVTAAGPTLEATLPIPNATSAAFAIDGSKIYIVDGSNLFVYSPGLPLRTVGLPSGGPASPLPQAVALFATGAMAYVADTGPAHGLDMVPYCANSITSTVAVGNAPALVAAIPNAAGMLDANSPNIDEVDVTTNSIANNGLCPPLITNSPTSHGFGTNFTAEQLIVTPDSKLAIILTSDHGVLVYDLGSKQTSVVALSGGAQPISGGVTPGGATLYVGATDKAVHRLDLTKSPPVDAQTIQITSLCPSVAAGCTPDLVVVRPVATPTTLTALSVTPVNPTLGVGTMQQFTATGTFSDKSTRDMTNFVNWTSSNTNVAVIGLNTNVSPPVGTTPGLAQALAAGTTTITASSAGVSGATTLTVK